MYDDYKQVNEGATATSHKLPGPKDETKNGIGKELYKGRMFTGSKQDASAVDDWLECIEDLPRDDSAKVFVARYFLEGDAAEWYKGNCMQEKTWADFKAMFKQRFYPQNYYEDEHCNFIRMKQIGSVAEYTETFNKSLKIVSEIYTLPEHILKIQYCQGLKIEVAVVIRPVLPLYNTLPEVQAAALDAETAQNAVPQGL